MATKAATSSQDGAPNVPFDVLVNAVSVIFEQQPGVLQGAIEEAQKRMGQQSSTPAPAKATHTLADVTARIQEANKEKLLEAVSVAENLEMDKREQRDIVMMLKTQAAIQYVREKDPSGFQATLKTLFTAAEKKHINYKELRELDKALRDYQNEKNVEEAAAKMEKILKTNSFENFKNALTTVLHRSGHDVPAVPAAAVAAAPPRRFTARELRDAFQGGDEEYSSIYFRQHPDVVNFLQAREAAAAAAAATAAAASASATTTSSARATSSSGARKRKGGSRKDKAREEEEGPQAAGGGFEEMEIIESTQQSQPSQPLTPKDLEEEEDNKKLEELKKRARVMGRGDPKEQAVAISTQARKTGKKRAAEPEQADGEAAPLPPPQTPAHANLPNELEVAPAAAVNDLEKEAPPRRVRRPWTVEETETLIHAVCIDKKLGAWAVLRDRYKHIFKDRTDVDLKDKWRNLERYHKKALIQKMSAIETAKEQQEGNTAAAVADINDAAAAAVAASTQQESEQGAVEQEQEETARPQTPRGSQRTKKQRKE